MASCIRPVKLLETLREMLSPRNFREKWNAGQLQFMCEGKLNLIVCTPIQGSNEQDMLLNTTQKILSFRIVDPQNEQSEYAMKNTQIRLNWQGFALERIEVMLTIFNSAGTCPTCGTQLFPRFQKDPKNKRSLNFCCSKCSATIHFAGDREEEVKILQLSDEYYSS